MENEINSNHPGPIALFGSGETAPSGQKIFDYLFKMVPHSPIVSILETPAGFELNSKQVAENVGQFISDHLQNYKPKVQRIPARKKGTENSPDHPEIVQPILSSDLIFMGPGSPTYAVRNLVDTLAWEYLIARHRLGAGLALSSATTVAISSFALPVYEIYKVGQDLHWQKGLDFFSPFGLSLIFIPHWNNQDGGANLDTSRCYMGVPRFEILLDLLPEGHTVIGIDENTGLIIDFNDSCFHVIGPGNITILSAGSEKVHPSGSTVKLTELGDFSLPDLDFGISPESWNTAHRIQTEIKKTLDPPNEIISLADQRLQSRQEKDWEAADQLREKIEKRGWIVMDTDEGYQLELKQD